MPAPLATGKPGKKERHVSVSACALCVPTWPDLNRPDLTSDMKKEDTKARRPPPPSRARHKKLVSVA